MSYTQISQFGHSSDIFNTKELNKPEIPTLPKRQRQTNIFIDLFVQRKNHIYSVLWIFRCVEQPLLGYAVIEDGYSALANQLFDKVF